MKRTFFYSSPVFLCVAFFSDKYYICEHDLFWEYWSIGVKFAWNKTKEYSHRRVKDFTTIIFLASALTNGAFCCSNVTFNADRVRLFERSTYAEKKNVLLLSRSSFFHTGCCRHHESLLRIKSKREHSLVKHQSIENKKWINEMFDRRKRKHFILHWRINSNSL